MRPGEGTSRFLIGLVTCFTTQYGIPAVALDAPRKEVAVRRLVVAAPEPSADVFGDMVTPLPSPT
ncbi:MAG: hypothetical protein H0U61_09110 [Nocardioidaceae bacterium]|nr:hypothetical protein [Nocardioidaceae bacterium]